MRDPKSLLRSTETSKNLNEILHGNIHEVSKSMTKMAGIFKAAMEITDSLFIRILGYKKKKNSISTDISMFSLPITLEFLQIRMFHSGQSKLRNGPYEHSENSQAQQINTK